MASRKLRFVLALLPLVLLISLLGFIAPGASAQGTINVEFVEGHQPADAKVGELITAVAFDPSPTHLVEETPVPGPFVEVLVTETITPSEGAPYDVPVADAEVSFDLATDESGTLATGELNVDPRYTDEDGIARFAPEVESENPLSIADPNQPFTTGYELVPVAVPPPPPSTTSAPFIGAAFALEGFNGEPSTPFDIWEDGCKGNGCQVNLTPGTSSDNYKTSENVGMGASQLGLGGTNISCPTQQLIFSSDLFFHFTTGNGPVFLISHISAADRKKMANNGNKVMGWCVGLKTAGPWHFAQQNTNGIPGLQTPGDLYVGMAPKCPKVNPSSKAPCIVSQGGDGLGGTYIRGWLPGGDPPRRT
jgi:hypothetical protein